MHKVKRVIAQEMTPNRILFFAEEIKKTERELAVNHRRMSKQSIRVKAIQKVYSDKKIWKMFKLTLLSFQETVSIVLSEIPQEIINLFGEKEPLEGKNSTFEEWQSKAPWREHFLKGEIGGLYGFDH